ncbi:hypothetical protein C8R47DRAFT_1162528 [Mycena vitilis]|nr:hypothetical protein C8R47DRAFT_1162528 [Mycena vitilis]
MLLRLISRFSCLALLPFVSLLVPPSPSHPPIHHFPSLAHPFLPYVPPSASFPHLSTLDAVLLLFLSSRTQHNR